MSKKYLYNVDIRWSDEDQIFIARVPELAGVVTHGDSVVEAAKMAEEAISLHLRSLERHNEKAPAPISLKKLSGNIPLRLGKDLHENAVVRQNEVGAKSLNDYLKSLVEADSNLNFLDEANQKIKSSKRIHSSPIRAASKKRA